MSYVPSPVDTSHIALPNDLRDLTELLARDAHEVWARRRMAEGWRPGPARDEARKEHPDLIPYAELPESEKEYDREVSQATLRLILALGYRIEKAHASVPLSPTPLEPRAGARIAATPIGAPDDRGRVVRLGLREDAVPLVLGVTGHRDLREEDRPALAARVHELLVDLGARYPATPLVLLSSLAEGADRLVARVSLELGVRLIVPLPLPLEVYQEDFPATSSRAEMAELLAGAATVFTLPPAPGSARDALSRTARGLHYARASAFIVHHSQLLIALWDGVPSEAEGGTAQTVRFKLEGVPDGYGVPRSVLDAVETGLVFHVVAPRSGADGAPTARWLYPVGYADQAQARAACEGVWERNERFNRDARRLEARSTPPLLAASELAPREAALGPILRSQATADALALHYQARMRRTLQGVLFLVFLAAVFHQRTVSAQLPSRLAAALYVAALGAAYLCYLWARRAEYQKKHLDYRALSEGLRVQTFWTLAGLGGSVADHYLRKQRSELDWIRHAMRALDIGTSPEERPGADGALHAVLSRWVDDQSRYFAAAARRHDSRNRVFRKIGYASFLFGLALAFVKPFVDPSYLLVDAITFGPVIAALLVTYADRMALSEHAKQYGRMSELFDNAARGLRRCLEGGRFVEARDVLRDLGEEALAENGDWLLLHRERPLKVPAAS